MNESERLFVRVDATIETGLGHYGRCLAIAQSWRESSRQVTFVGQYPESLREELGAEGIDVQPLAATCPDRRDLEVTADVVSRGAPVVLDGYHFDYAYQKALAAQTRLLVVDDIGHLSSYAGSYLLNANVYADEIRYAEAPSCRLLGPRYAPLRRRFREIDVPAQQRRGPIRRVLVCLGGADARNDTLQVLRGLAETRVPLEHVRAVVGPLNPHAEVLERFAASQPHMDLCRNPKDMCAELVAADFVFAGAGTISAELAYLGKPSLLLAVADNQLQTGPRMAAAGAAAYAGDIRALGFEELVLRMREALADSELHGLIQAKGPALVDGQGSIRIRNLLSGTNHDRARYR